ncbi:MAG: glycosyltransferase, partial [Thermoleophilaceae bacterium]|nr:glycosyltransferase [Thermoleophilaceae bacterium]
LAYESGRLRSIERPVGKRVALTFDDGPDPKWTPRIAAVLRELDVPATFFVVGTEATRYPEILRNLHRGGFEIGNHTFTHANLEVLPEWRRRSELSLTDSAVAGAIGIRTRLFRPPYSATVDAITVKQAAAYAEAARDGYVLALSDFDSKDWKHQGAAKIAAASTPPSGRGGIVLMHDGGGNRAQTVAALKLLIPKLRARGFSFVGLSALTALPESQIEIPASSRTTLNGRVMMATVRLSLAVATFLEAMLIPIAILALLRSLLLVLFASRHSSRMRRAEPLAGYVQPVSILVPAYNEAVGIERSVISLAGSDYPEFEVIVIDDGSTDDTAGIVERLGLERVSVIRQANAGKPAALNAGLAAARYETIVTVDGDTMFERDTLNNLVQPFGDPSVGAASGNAKVGNRRGMLGRWQHIEYVIGFNLDRRLYDVLECMPTIPGAIGAFRRSVLMDVGAFSADTLAEDTDITLAIGRAGWRVPYVEGARAWTEAPSSLNALWFQRYRWSYGTMQAVWKHKAAVFSREKGRGEGRIGHFTIPYVFLFQILLPLLSPLIDVLAIYGIVFLNPLNVLAYWLGFNALMLLLALYAFRLDHESLRPLWALPLQQFVYRQLMYLVIIESMVSAMLGLRLRWHRAERVGNLDLRPGADDSSH